MDATDVFGPTLSALLLLTALGYSLLTLAPVIWPAILARRAGPQMPRRTLFVAVVAVLVYGVFSFLAFVVILPIEVFGIFVAPPLEEAELAYGEQVLSITGFVREYWWLLVPVTQLVLTWRITKHLIGRWSYICAAPPDS